MVFKGSTSQLELELKQVFAAVDVDENGTMEKEEFIQAVKSNEDIKRIVMESRALSHLIVMHGDFESAFNSLDGDGGGAISYDEFEKFVKTELEEENIRNIFKAIDSDGNRYLTKNELIKAFKTNKEVIKLVQESTIFKDFIEAEDWDSVFAEIDRDHSGDGENKIDYPEFWKFCKKCSAKAHANNIKRQARQKRIEYEKEQSIRHKELLSRITTHISAHNGCSGSYMCSIVPDRINFPCLPNGQNPYDPNAFKTNKRKLSYIPG